MTAPVQYLRPYTTDAPPEPNPARWSICRGASLPCRGCDNVIGAGEPYRLISVADQIHCCGCAKRVTGEDPPADLPVQGFEFKTQPPRPSTWSQATGAVIGKTAGTVVRTARATGRPVNLDARQRQTGERD